MHNHTNENDKSSGHRGMMWMMIPCLLLLGLLFFSGGRLSSSWYLWLIIIGVCIGPHIWMMLKGHGSHINSKDKSSEEETQSIKADRHE
jgi:hypothetical protein